MSRAGFGKRNGEPSFMYSVTAPVNAHTRELRKLAYPDGKTKEVKNLLPLLDERGLAFWYLDDGSCQVRKGKGSAGISTYSFTYDEHLMIQKYFKEKWDINIGIGIKNNKYYYVSFNASETKKLFALIARYVPPCLEYKLTPEFRNYNDKHDFSTAKHRGYAAARVKRVRTLSMSSKLYDITVENDHNFVAAGTVVHNCQRAHDIGLRTWFCPWMRMQHVGTYIFGGSLADLAQIGAPATADTEQLRKFRGKDRDGKPIKQLEGTK